jgi:hypothetical protein
MRGNHCHAHRVTFRIQWITIIGLVANESVGLAFGDAMLDEFLDEFCLMR